MTSSNQPGGGSAKGPGDEPEGRSSFLVILAVIAGVALLYWLSTSFVDWNKTQECAAYGKRDCAPRMELNRQ